MPQKKRLELKSFLQVKGIDYSAKKTFVFVLDFQQFYENDLILKVILPNNKVDYIQLKKTLSISSISSSRNFGLGIIEDNLFIWLEKLENPIIYTCIDFFTKLHPYIQFPLFFICINLTFRTKDKRKTEDILSTFVYSFITFIDLVGWPISLYSRSTSEYKHFITICHQQINSSFNTNKKIFTPTYKKLSSHTQTRTPLNIQNFENKFTDEQKSDFFYWFIKEIARNDIHIINNNQFWYICLDILFCYAQSLYLWIP